MDLTPPEDLDELDDEDEDTGGAVNAVGAMGAGTAEGPRQQIRRAAAAWTAGLDDLDAATRLTVRPGHALEFSFRLPSFEPHLAVVERDTGVWNEKEAAAVAAEIRLRYPASGVRI